MDARALSGPVISNLAEHANEQFADSRDAFLGLAKPCASLGIDLWECLGSRLDIAGQQPWRRRPTSSRVADPA